MTALVQSIATLHERTFQQIERWTGSWALGLLARLTFLAVLYFYFLNSALTKIGEGFFGFLAVQPSAWYQIAPQAVEAALGDFDAISFFPYGLVVYAGTYAEFILPALIVVGLFTRLAALGMIGFIIVQTIVDIAIHKVDAGTIGALFDRFSDSVIADQRTLWIAVLAILVLKGAGALSLDGVLTKFFPAQHRNLAQNQKMAAPSHKMRK